MSRSCTHLISMCPCDAPVYPCGFVCVCLSVRDVFLVFFCSGCGFSSAITLCCRQFAVDLPLSPSISG